MSIRREGNFRQREADASLGGTVLFRAIQERQWKAALSRVVHSPQDVSTLVYRNDFKDGTCYLKKFPLHYACRRNPPSIIISALVTAHPPAVMTKCDGNLPIHEALDFGASLDAIKILITANPAGLHEESVDGLLPIDIFNQKKDAWSGEKQVKLERLLKEGVSDEDLEISTHLADLEIDSGAEEEEVPAVAESLETALQDEGWKKVSFQI